MENINLSKLGNLGDLTDIALRDGIDMRPTLLRVITDLYVHKLTHTPDEERHYTELALRLLDCADVATRAAVAARLANHLSPPAPVIARLAADLPAVSSMVRMAPRPQPQPRPKPTEKDDETEQQDRQPPAQPASASASDANELSDDTPTSMSKADTIRPDIADELNELFFAAKPNERRLILLNLDIVASLPGGGAGINRDASVGRQLEAAALARKREDFTQALARSLAISREQAQRIARDQSGEPLVVAAKTLNIPRDLLYRILLFVNTAIGHSVERVHALAVLYDEVSSQAAEHFVAIWQALDKSQRDAPNHQGLPAHEGIHPRHLPAARQVPAGHAPAASGKMQRRDAS